MVAVQNYHGNPAPPGKPVLTFQIGDVIELLRGDPDSPWWEVRTIPFGKFPGIFKPVTSASSLLFVGFPGAQGCAGAPELGGLRGGLEPGSCSRDRPCPCAAKTLLPRACPRLIPGSALQGRLLQTKKSGYFPSSSVKPCPVDARVSAKEEMEPGAPAGAAGAPGQALGAVTGDAAPAVPVALLSLLLETSVLPLSPWTLNEAFYYGRISEEVDPSSHGCKCLVRLVSALFPRLGLV